MFMMVWNPLQSRHSTQKRELNSRARQWLLVESHLWTLPTSAAAAGHAAHISSQTKLCHLHLPWKLVDHDVPQSQVAVKDLLKRWKCSEWLHAFVQLTCTQADRKNSLVSKWWSRNVEKNSIRSDRMLNKAMQNVYHIVSMFNPNHVTI